MEATASVSRRVLVSADEAKSPQRILVRSLLKSRNKLRAKYRELRAECKRWRNQAAAVEKSRSAWRQRAMAGEMALQNEQAERAALGAQVQELRDSSAAQEATVAASHTLPADPQGVEKKGR
jgi:predicted  nucleic acid-binding Zn-ribbon protein